MTAGAASMAFGQGGGTARADGRPCPHALSMAYPQLRLLAQLPCGLGSSLAFGAAMAGMLRLYGRPWSLRTGAVASRQNGTGRGPEGRQRGSIESLGDVDG
jgi:hypothetical protein